ncbi:MAG: outer membrane beta-barrel protein [Flavobacteriales bacterium]|nr:outer membrane beta-barrel protein [Flavobacteriales bacterium]
MRATLLFVVSVLFAVLAGAVRGQTTVRGTVTDGTGQTVIGANVLVKDTPGLGTVTDLDGAYTLVLERSTPTTLVFSFMGLATQEHVVQPGAGVVVLNVGLKEGNVELQTFEVEGKARRGSDVYLDRMKVNSATALDFISRDVMLKTGDADAAAAVRRISGVSTVGAFVTVRGLADRYLVTGINGGRVPTLDPFTNNLRLDLFPTGLMDNIVITKTLTPDLPGDWAGAYLSMNTSDYPQRLTVSVASTVGYNPNSTFQDIVSAGSSSTDRWGRDDGMRGIPAGVPDAVEDYPVFRNPGLYEQLGLLGLGGTLARYGITANTPGFNTTSMSTGSTLQHLALTELGLLAPALVLDPNAVAAAVGTYNSTYDLAYFSPRVNGELAALNTAWDNSRWRVGTAKGSPNYNLSFTVGNQVDLFKKSGKPRQLGFLLGLRYATETQNDERSTLLRTIERYEDSTPGDTYNRKGDQRISIVSAGYNALGNLSFKLDRNNSFSVLAMGNILGQNNARYLTFLDPTVSGETFISEEQYWEQRKLWVFQYGSKHFIPAVQLTVNADLSYSDGQRDLLDLMVVQYVKPSEGQPITDVDGALRPPGRIYRFLNETVLDGRLGFELPLDEPGKQRTLKFGGQYRTNERRNDQKYYVVTGAPGPAQWETPGRFTLRPDGRFTSLYTPFGSFKDNDIGILDVGAAYVMTDYAVTKKFRVAGGLRAERTALLSDIYRYYQEGVAADDPARGTVGDLSVGGSSSPEPKPAIPGTIDQWDLLPSVNLIWKVRDGEDKPMNVRASYFRSLSRPSFREFSVVQYYDYQLQAPVYGNPALKMTRVDNFDLRVERYYANGANISLSGFYKRFTDHIELLQTAQGGFTWRNAARSRVVGAELEGRVKLLRPLEWRGNITVMDSESELFVMLDDQRVDYKTPMYGQAPYIVNSTLTYTFDSLKLDVSVSYNVQGPKLAVSNAELDPTGIRAYEMPRHVVDATVNKRWGKHWNTTFRVRDALNAPIRRTYRFAQGYTGDFDRYAFGTEYLLTLSYAIR